MRGLSVKQPWAGAIAYGPKRVENRPWMAPSSIIGETIAIHASSRLILTGCSAVEPPTPLRPWRRCPTRSAVLGSRSGPIWLTFMDAATLAGVAGALRSQAAVLDAEADQLIAEDLDARKNVGSPSMRVFVKQQIAQEFRNLARYLQPGT